MQTQMEVDRREFFRTVLGGAAIATAGAAAGAALIADMAEAAPLVIDKNLPLLTENFVQDAQRRRVWRCWWSRSRGRRVCGWRWI